MGSTSDPTTVVDEECRVVGVDNLRVVDASIMPSVVSSQSGGLDFLFETFTTVVLIKSLLLFIRKQI